MRKTLLLILFSLVIGNGIYSQQLGIAFSSGVGTWSMSELKSLNEAIHPDFDAELVTDFPAWFYYQPSLVVKMDKLVIGLNYTFQSTASRISAKDYSGEYRFDMNLHSDNVGAYLALYLVKWNKSRLSAYVKPGVSFSYMEINRYLELYGTVIDDLTVQCKATNYYFEPGMDFSFSIIPAISVSANLGYYIQAGKQDFIADLYEDDILANPANGEPVKPRWNGLRFGLSVMYTLKLKERDNTIQE